MTSIIIQSINYSGESASIVFTPHNSNIPINLGVQVLPYLFEPSLLTPPYDVYGTYTILTLNSSCPLILNVPVPTPTPTPTITPTRTSTPTPTPSEPFFLLFEDSSIATTENDESIEIDGRVEFRNSE